MMNLQNAAYLQRCSIHKEQFAELWPGQFICNSCFEAEFMTPEEVEPMPSELNDYLNSIQDSE
jgi:hypothetical protein